MKIKKTRAIYLLMAAIILAGGVSATAIAAQSVNERRASNIKSKGNFDFENGKVTIYSSDLIYLADEIDLLEDTYKTETVKALDQIGTYFNSDGTSTHGKGDSNISSSEAKLLPYGAIIDGIIYSQSIPTERTYTGTMPGQTMETHGNISAATEANLSLGTAAWVEGKLIVGNGMDNNSSYTQGKKDGYDNGYAQGNKDGYDSGYAKGNKDGYDSGYTKGNKDGYDSGYSQGYEDGASAEFIPYKSVDLKNEKNINNVKEIIVDCTDIQGYAQYSDADFLVVPTSVYENNIGMENPHMLDKVSWNYSNGFLTIHNSTLGLSNESDSQMVVMWYSSFDIYAR